MNSLFSRDTQIKAIESLLNDAEKHLGQFCTTLASYTRKTAKLRDKADILVRQLNEFASNEDPELRMCIKNLAEDVAMVQDYRQAEVERLEARVITPLKAYGNIVKIKRADLKRFSADRSRELKEIQRLEKMRLKNPADRQSIAEVNAQKATNNAHRSTRQMEESITEFQRQKLEDVKKVFSDFIMVEMLFHAKALEVYTHTFQNLETMDIDKDLEIFMRRIQVSDLPPMDTQILASVRSTSSLPAYSSPTPSTTRPPPNYFSRSRKSTLRQQEHIEDEEDEEEEEEEEEEEIYESEGPYEEQQTLRESYAAQYTRARRQT